MLSPGLSLKHLLSSSAAHNPTFSFNAFLFRSNSAPPFCHLFIKICQSLHNFGTNSCQYCDKYLTHPINSPKPHPLLRFCGCCRNLEFTITIINLAINYHGVKDISVSGLLFSSNSSSRVICYSHRTCAKVCISSNVICCSY